MDTLRYTTAGGVVVNDQNQILALDRAVMRNGRLKEECRLPKGHIDPGETAEAAAVREVGEESGYWGVRIVADLGHGHSSFVRDGMQYERDERYFLMRLEDPNPSEQQPVCEEEALFVPRWIDAERAPETLSYPTERDFAARAVKWLREQG